MDNNYSWESRATLAALVITGMGAVYAMLNAYLQPLDKLVASVPDDAFYLLQIARNLAEGHGLTFDRINPTNGFQPLWLYLLTALYKAGGSWNSGSFFRAALLLQSVIGLAAGWIAVFSLKRVFSGGGVLAAGVLMTFLVIIPNANGLESAIQILCLALLFSRRDLLFAENRRFAGPLTYGVLLGLTVLARLDTVFLALAAIGWAGIAMLRKERKAAGFFAVAGGFALVFVPYIWFNLIEFGHLLPVSGALKSTFPHPHLDLGSLRRVPSRDKLFLLTAILYPAAVYTAARFRQLRREFNWTDPYRGFMLVLIAGVAGHACYMLLFMNWAIAGWHFKMYDFFAVILIAEVVSGLIKFASRLGRPGRYTAAAYWIALLLMCAVGMGAVSSRSRIVPEGEIAGQMLKAALWVDDNLPPGARIAMSDCGVMGYFCGRQVVNLDGLVNSFEFQRVLQEQRLGEELDRNGVEYLAVHDLSYDGRLVNGTYGEHDFAYVSRLYGGHSDPLTVTPADEVYRGNYVHNSANVPSAFLIWRLR